MAFADALIADRHLEAKSVGIEVVARYRRDFTPRLLPAWKRWLAGNHSANWATTDAICGALIGPLLLQHPRARRADARLGARSQHVGAAGVDRRPDSARAARRVARPGLRDRAAPARATSEDLIQKAVGWALREAGKTDMPRLERYLRANGAGDSAHDAALRDRAVSRDEARALLAATRRSRTTATGD